MAMRVGVDGGVRDSVDELHAFDQAGDHGFADPAQGQADHGDAELNAVDDFVEMLVQALDDARADAAGFDELLDAGVADADQGEFGCREERIGCHQEKDQKAPGAAQRRSWKGNSNIQRLGTDGVLSL